MNVSRRGFLMAGGLAGAMAAVPNLIPARVLGRQAPSKKIQEGVIGCGRIANGMDIFGLWQNRDLATVTALSDCDAKRMRATKRKTGERFEGDLPDLKLCQNYRELLADKSVDTVMVCVPDFWHAQLCVEAAFAGKDVYVQKPMAMTVSESRSIVTVFKKAGRVFHIGSQLRSEGESTLGPQFRKTAEYVRNGRVGKVLRVEVGLPLDAAEPSGLPLVQPVPPRSILTGGWDVHPRRRTLSCGPIRRGKAASRISGVRAGWRFRVMTWV